MSAKVDQGKSFRLVFKGRLTVDRAGELKKAFQDALATGRAIDVDFSQASEVDITFLQLLYAAGRAAIQKGQSFALPTVHPPAVAKALRAAGLCAHVGLCLHTDQQCLWTGGAE
jgi:anti-anti-sigma regulatory factor